MMAEGPDGEIGRRSGLKIRGPERAVGVQVPLRAPNSPLKVLVIALVALNGVSQNPQLLNCW